MFPHSFSSWAPSSSLLPHSLFCPRHLDLFSDPVTHREIIGTQDRVVIQLLPHPLSLASTALGNLTLQTLYLRLFAAASVNGTCLFLPGAFAPVPSPQGVANFSCLSEWSISLPLIQEAFHDHSPPLLPSGISFFSCCWTLVLWLFRSWGFDLHRSTGSCYRWAPRPCIPVSPPEPHLIPVIAKAHSIWDFLQCASCRRRDAYSFHIVLRLWDGESVCSVSSFISTHLVSDA